MVIRFLHNKVWVHLPTLDEIERKDLVMAAWLWPGILLVVAGLRAWSRHKSGLAAATAESWLLGIFAVVLGVSLLTPRLQAHVFLWTLRFLSIFGYVVINLLLAAGFYLFVVPFGLAMRFSGKDLLDWRARGRKPRWHEHRRRPDRKAYYRQF